MEEFSCIDTRNLSTSWSTHPMELASGRKVSGVALRPFFSRQGHANVGQMVIQFERQRTKIGNGLTFHWSASSGFSVFVGDSPFRVWQQKAVNHVTFTTSTGGDFFQYEPMGLSIRAARDLEFGIHHREGGALFDRRSRMEMLETWGKVLRCIQLIEKDPVPL